MRQPSRFARKTHCQPRLEALEQRWLPSAITEFPLPPADVSDSVHGMTSGPDGDLWVSGFYSIYKVATNGSVTKYAMPTPASAHHQAWADAVAFGPDDNLWFLEHPGISLDDGKLWLGRLNPQTGQIDSFPLPPDPGNATTDSYEWALLERAPDGSLWAPEFYQHNPENLERVTITPGGTTPFVLQSVPLPGTNIQNQTIVTGEHLIGPDGTAWFLIEASHLTSGQPIPDYVYTVGTLTPTGPVLTGGSFEIGQDLAMSDETKIAMGQDGNFWTGYDVMDSSRAITDHQIWRVSPSGAITKYELTLPALNMPGARDFTRGPDGNIWFTYGAGVPNPVDVNTGVGRVTPGGVITLFPLASAGGTQSRQGNPSFLTWGPDDNIWYVSESEYTVYQGVGRVQLDHRVYASSPGEGSNSVVSLYNGYTGALKRSIQAYPTGFTGGVRTAVGDVNGDGVPDLITAPGPGKPGMVHVYDGVTGALTQMFLAYPAAFQGGVFIASADVNHDGYADIITGAGPGGAPQVEVFSGKDGSLLRSFLAYPAVFYGGVHVAAGDLDGDGFADLVTAPGAGGAPQVETWSGATGKLLRSFLPYPVQFAGGVWVAAGDMDGDNRADIITGAGAGGAPQVEVFRGADLALLHSFLAFDSRFLGGVRVGYVPDMNGNGAGEILAGAGPGGAPQVSLFDGKDLQLLDSYFAAALNYPGGVYVGGG